MTTVPKEMSSPRTQRETKSRDLRDWMAAVNRIGELKHIDGADWDVEIGTVTEMGHHRGERSHALLFDDIKGYPKGYRVLSNTLNTAKRLAVTMHMDIKGNRLDIVRDMRERLNNLNYIPPQYVDDGPILENVSRATRSICGSSPPRSGTRIVGIRMGRSRAGRGCAGDQGRIHGIADPGLF